MFYFVFYLSLWLVDLDLDFRRKHNQAHIDARLSKINIEIINTTNQDARITHPRTKPVLRRGDFEIIKLQSANKQSISSRVQETQRRSRLRRSVSEGMDYWLESWNKPTQRRKKDSFRVYSMDSGIINSQTGIMTATGAFNAKEYEGSENTPWQGTGMECRIRISLDSSLRATIHET